MTDGLDFPVDEDVTPPRAVSAAEAELDRLWAESKEPSRAPRTRSEPYSGRAPTSRSETIYPGGASGKLLNGWTTAPAPPDTPEAVIEAFAPPKANDEVGELLASTDRLLAMHRERHR